MGRPVTNSGTDVTSTSAVTAKARGSLTLWPVAATVMLVLPLLTLLSQVIEGTSGSDVDLNCSELGFNTPNLMCSDCETLGRFSLGDLKRDCGRCCTEDGKKLDEAVKYSKAILEVCG